MLVCECVTVIRQPNAWIGLNKNLHTGSWAQNLSRVLTGNIVYKVPKWLLFQIFKE